MQNTIFTHSLDSLKRINGGVFDDLKIAKTAAHEYELFLTEKLKIIEEYTNLIRVLDSNSEHELTSIIISMNHLTGGIKELVELYRKTTLIEVFDPLLLRAQEINKKAKAQIDTLLIHIKS